MTRNYVGKLLGIPVYVNWEITDEEEALNIFPTIDWTLEVIRRYRRDHGGRMPPEIGVFFETLKALGPMAGYEDGPFSAEVCNHGGRQDGPCMYCP